MLKWSLKAFWRASTKTLNKANPPNSTTKMLGAIIARLMATGAKSPDIKSNAPKIIPLIYRVSLGPEAFKIPVTGPVIQVGTLPKKPMAMEPTPQDRVIIFIGGLYPWDFKIAIPWEL